MINGLGYQTADNVRFAQADFVSQQETLGRFLIQVHPLHDAIGRGPLKILEGVHDLARLGSGVIHRDSPVASTVERYSQTGSQADFIDLIREVSLLQIITYRPGIKHLV